MLQRRFLHPHHCFLLQCLLCNRALCLPRPSFHLSTKPAPDCLVVSFAFEFQALKFAALLAFTSSSLRASTLSGLRLLSFVAKPGEPFPTLLLYHALGKGRSLAHLLPSYPLFRVHMPDCIPASVGCTLFRSIPFFSLIGSELVHPTLCRVVSPVWREEGLMPTGWCTSLWHILLHDSPQCCSDFRIHLERMPPAWNMTGRKTTTSKAQDNAMTVLMDTHVSQDFAV